MDPNALVLISISRLLFKKEISLSASVFSSYSCNLTVFAAFFRCVTVGVCKIPFWIFLRAACTRQGAPACLWLQSFPAERNSCVSNSVCHRSFKKGRRMKAKDPTNSLRHFQLWLQQLCRTFFRLVVTRMTSCVLL